MIISILLSQLLRSRDPIKISLSLSEFFLSEYQKDRKEREKRKKKRNPFFFLSSRVESAKSGGRAKETTERRE